jgi:tetratricopeptide (TPR) repeat protein
MDFGPALRAAEESERLTDRSRDRLAAGDPAGALEDGQRAVRLHEQPEALRRLAVAALAARRFEEAVDAWRRLRDFDRRTQG